MLSGSQGVTKNPAPQAGSNAVTPDNASPTEGARLGDEMFPVLLANAVRDKHITEGEAHERYAIHRVVETSPSGLPIERSDDLVTMTELLAKRHRSVRR